MHKPSSTYRIQFHKNFNLQAFDQIIPYLIELGIGAVYASPIFQAVPGSMHGYDVINPLRINPEIGTETELLKVSEKLKVAGIIWIQDIVPNHMAFHPDNVWLKDVLQKGSSSEFARFFDVDTQKAPLMAPFLAEDLKEGIKEGKIKLSKLKGEYFLSYGDFNWPVNEDTAQMLERLDFQTVNRNKPVLKTIIHNQHYRLCHWQETDHTINYRRFFTVNGLICLNMQHQETFIHYHRYIFELIKKGIFQGLRIDHIDGLFDPKAYLQNLREAVGKDIYIVVEKILEDGEQMPEKWKVQGNTGYDFLAMVNNLLTNQGAEKSFTTLYRKVTGKKLNPTKLIYEKKRQILFKHMGGELNNLLEELLSLSPVSSSVLQLAEVKQALGEMLIRMPVYRYYNYSFPLSGRHAENVKNLLMPVIEDGKLARAGKFLHSVLLEKTTKNDAIHSHNVSHFFQRCMQFTGPLMAKGVEDTLMYTYNRFIAHNEVGDAPDAFGLSIQEFHQQMQDRQVAWPLSLNASSTHDTKKGEDVRARLNVLSELPDEWEALVQGLSKAFDCLKNEIPSFKRLHDNDVYFLLQTIIGTFPLTRNVDQHINKRLQDFIAKALRESKKRSDWANPNEPYEQKLSKFSQVILDRNQESENLIRNFLKRISDFAIINSLAQLTLKFTCPGIPDMYQGTELWDLSLVDPDNRRPVDFKYRKELLEELMAPVDLKALWEKKDLGRVKMWLTKSLLGIRKTQHKVFEYGKYIPITVRGKYSAHICAFARKYKKQWLITAVPMGFARCCKVQDVQASDFDWEDTALILPKEAPVAWENLITQRKGHKDPLCKGILINHLFSDIPLAVIKLTGRKKERSAGILMHISSLPSPFGMGDLGPGAFKFVDFLSDGSQRYWQILPLNPVKKERGYSPYSSSSAMAGNILFISIEALVADGLLAETALKNFVLPDSTLVDFEKAEKVKQLALKQAYKQFKKSKNEKLLNAYQSFCEAEQFWLNDFSIYTFIKHYHGNKEWISWPEKFKNKDAKAIADFAKKNENEIAEIKWQQFVFFNQWYRLKNYANKKGIAIIGDLPFYLDYDSVEVWAGPDDFMLDQNLNKLWEAAVPPDYFNEKGQLWGMPIYNWEKMKKDDFSWWEKRLRHNRKVYDLVRLDHFRAFSAFWQVRASNGNAVKGRWKAGVGQKFFKIMKRKLGELPFIAEDLGEITEDVNGLRKKFNFPGMKVIQFAFGEDLASSDHIPHNFESADFIVYSGTHDNNTTLGWFKNETDNAVRQRLTWYLGSVVNEKTINKHMIRLCYASIARIAIIPMQDILQLDETSRMNRPGHAEKNWRWKVIAGYLDAKMINWLKTEAELYARQGI